VSIRSPIIATLCVIASRSAAAAPDTPREPIAVIGLRPAVGNFDGPFEIRRLPEAQKLRRVANDVVRQVAQHPVIDDAGLRAALGVEYLVDFMDCHAEVACVSKLVAKLKKKTTQGVFGDYTVVDKKYQIRLRLLDIAQRKVVKEVEFKLDQADIEDRMQWRREVEPLFATTAAPEPTPPEPTPPGPPPPSEPPPASGDSAAVPELAPITSEGGDTSNTPAKPAAAGAGAFIDNSVLDAISRGIAWHGYFQNYSALGVRGGFRKDAIVFDDRLQLEFESDINQVRVIGKPQLLFDVLDNQLEVHFREMYAARGYKRVDLSVGERILTWGITDFWPVVDIINPRDYSPIRNWRPIDEKLPVPVLQTTWLFGAVTLHLIGVPILGRSSFQLDQTKPFALPIPAPPGSAIEQHKAAATLSNAGGGLRIDLAVGTWKLSLYGLVGRDPLPSVYAQTDPMTGATTFEVDNDRVAMGAVSIQGNLGFLGAILKTEAAAYDRLDDGCKGMDADLGGVPQCFYLHRVPTGRANLALERNLLPGLDGHLQFITEYTRSADVPRLPPAIAMIAPGLPEQYPLNEIFTLRLQGDYAHSDFRPMAFVYWSLGDEALFGNLDLEYHLADGFALALGGFLFHGYASPNKNRFTLSGSLESSSNVYLRATAWF
jgi:hypothetical protein